MMDESFIKRAPPFHVDGTTIFSRVPGANLVIPGRLTVGQTTLGTEYNTTLTGHVHINNGSLYFNDGSAIRYLANSTLGSVNIPVSGTDAIDHAYCLQIDGNNILCVQAKGDGAGGIEDPKAIVYEQLVYVPSSDTAITAAGGITVTKAIMRVAGDGGAIDITANPQIVAGTDGQVVIIQGTHDTNTVTLDDGTGLALSAQCVLAAQDNITLMYDSGDSEWIETSRTTVA